MSKKKNVNSTEYKKINHVNLAQTDAVVIMGTEKSDVYNINPEFFVQDRHGVEIKDSKGEANTLQINKMGMPDLQVDLNVSPVDAGEFGTYTMTLHHNNSTKTVTFEGGHIDKIVSYGWCGTGPGQSMFVWKNNPKTGRPDYYNTMTKSFVSETNTNLIPDVTILPVNVLMLGTNGDDRIFVAKSLQSGRQYEVTGGEGNDTFVFTQEEMRLNNIFIVDTLGENRIVVNQPMSIMPMAPITIERVSGQENQFVLRFGSNQVMFTGGAVTTIGKAVNGSEMKMPIFTWRQNASGDFDFFDNRLRLFVGDQHYLTRFKERLGEVHYPERVVSMIEPSGSMNMLSDK